jgi:hypothetical protein
MFVLTQPIKRAFTASASCLMITSRMNEHALPLAALDEPVSPFSRVTFKAEPNLILDSVLAI